MTLQFITGADESAYREEVKHLSVCRENNLLLNTVKTKELVIDYRREKTDITPLIISGDRVEQVSDFCFLGLYIEEGPDMERKQCEGAKKAQQHLNFLRVLRRNDITQRLPLSFYRCPIESTVS